MQMKIGECASNKNASGLWNCGFACLLLAVWGLACQGSGLMVRVISRKLWLVWAVIRVFLALGLPLQAAQAAAEPTLDQQIDAWFGTVGLGNIAGVAIGIQNGGPGVAFWLFLSGFLGMSTKFAECTLGVKYREFDAEGRVHGGAMEQRMPD